MTSLIICHDEFKSTKNGFLIIMALVAILILLAEPLVGLLVILIVITLFSFNVGIEVDHSNNRYRYFKSFFGIKSGKWETLERYKAQIILKKNMKGEVLGPRLVSSFNYKKIVYDVNLTDGSHRMRLSLKKCKSLELAKEFAKTFEEKAGFPLEKYNPVISEKTRLRRARRRK